MSELIVNEIFLSIQGEGSRAGLPCVLVRLTGCNLRCDWCDTSYAWSEGRPMSVDDVLARVSGLGCRRVEVTGGEPLVQATTAELLARLCDAGCQTLLETNGSLDISPLDPRVIRIVDFKCPSSGQADSNRWENIDALRPRDEVKFVLADREDFDFAASAVERYNLTDRCAVTFSPVAGRLALADLAAWILASGLDVRLGVQLHKIIWKNKERGV